jgi:hypothetical protein
MVLMLDLRYAARLSLPEISSLLNLALSTVQWRIARFESGVLITFGTDTIEPSVPDGWLWEPGTGRGTSLLRNRARAAPVSAIRLEVIPVRSGLIELGAGLSSTQTPSGRTSVRSAIRARRIWPVVFADEACVRFVPDSWVQKEDNSDIQVADIVERARADGLTRLQEAIGIVVDGYEADTSS